MINALRWIAVVPATLLGWCIAFFLGSMLYSGLDHLCPQDQWVSGMCISEWFRYAEEAIFCFSAALAAFLVVVLAVLTAPSHSITIAWTVFALGCIAAIYMAWETSALKEFIFAVLGGLFGVFLVIKRERRQAKVIETNPY